MKEKYNKYFTYFRQIYTWNEKNATFNRILKLKNKALD